MQLHAVFLLPGHDGQLRGHGLEAVPGALVLQGGLFLMGGGGRDAHVKLTGTSSFTQTTSSARCDSPSAYSEEKTKQATAQWVKTLKDPDGCRLFMLQLLFL